MALTGIEIYKHLPKTNCKECGFPTCLAFAMKLAQKGVELSQCPHVSEEAKQALEAAARPPIHLVTIGAGERKIEVGNEVVLFRHEKTFFNKPGLVIKVKDTESSDAIAELVDKAASYSVERVGMELQIDGFAVENASGDAASFAKCVEAIKAKSDLPLVLMSKDAAAMEAALKTCSANKPLIYTADSENCAQMAELAKTYQCPIAAAHSDGLGELADITQKLMDAGIEDIVVDPGTRSFGDTLASLTQLRRLAIKKSYQPLGFPVITFPGEGASTPEEEAVLAGQHIAKYAGIIVLSHFDPSIVYPLLTLRLNIYTDPQKPIQVQPGIYKIGEPKESSPLLTTTNFSLTYFSIAGEVESSAFPAWLMVCDTEGLSVLTSWAAGKFDAEKIAKTVKETNASENIGHRNIIIPGHVAVLRGELEEELPDWKIMVGPREAVDIGGYLKQNWTA